MFCPSRGPNGETVSCRVRVSAQVRGFAGLLALRKLEDEQAEKEAADVPKPTEEDAARRRFELGGALALKYKDKQARTKHKEIEGLPEEVDDVDPEANPRSLGLEKLADALHKIPMGGRGPLGVVLRDVRLTECSLGDDEVGVLAHTLEQGAVSVLELGGNQITSIGCKLLAASTGLTSLRELHLNGNDVGDLGVEALCRGFWGYEPVAERLAIEKRKRLKARNLTAKAKRAGKKGEEVREVLIEEDAPRPASRLVVPVTARTCRSGSLVGRDERRGDAAAAGLSEATSVAAAKTWTFRGHRSSTSCRTLSARRARAIWRSPS